MKDIYRDEQKASKSQSSILTPNYDIYHFKLNSMIQLLLLLLALPNKKKKMGHTEHDIITTANKRIFIKTKHQYKTRKQAETSRQTPPTTNFTGHRIHKAALDTNNKQEDFIMCWF